MSIPVNMRSALSHGFKRPLGLLSVPAPDAVFERFWLSWDDNNENMPLAEDQDGVIDNDAGTINVWYPGGSDLSAVVFRWDVPEHDGDDYIVTVGGVVKTSGSSTFNFAETNPQTFIVMQEPGTTNFGEYIVTMYN